MYQNIGQYTQQQNPMINQFNGFVAQNPVYVPFQTNQLINNNPHVVNNLNTFVRDHQNLQQRMPQLQEQLRQTGNPIQTQNQRPTQANRKSMMAQHTNIIKDMLKPVVISKTDAAREVLSNYKIREDIQKDAVKNTGIKRTNVPYKPIIKDHVVVVINDKIKEEDLVVHKAQRGVDDDRAVFDNDLQQKEQEGELINTEIQIEFHIDNYDKHKQKFDYKESFIRNIAFKNNTFDDSKQDCIEFYKQKQKEAEDGLKMIDRVLENLVDEGIISKDELPTDDSSIEVDMGAGGEGVEGMGEPESVVEVRRREALVASAPDDTDSSCTRGGGVMPEPVIMPPVQPAPRQALTQTSSKPNRMPARAGSRAPVPTAARRANTPLPADARRAPPRVP